MSGTRRAVTARRVVAIVSAALALVAGLVLVGPGTSVAGSPTRYLDPVFSSVNVDKDLVYGRVRHLDGSVERLYLDLYRPAGDQRRNRPVLIFIHGGDSSV